MNFINNEPLSFYALVDLVSLFPSIVVGFQRLVSLFRKLPEGRAHEDCQSGRLSALFPLSAWLSRSLERVSGS